MLVVSTNTCIMVYMMKITLDEAVATIVNSEMVTIRKMRKRDMFGLIRELLEERCLEMSNDALIDFYNEVKNETTV